MPFVLAIPIIAVVMKRMFQFSGPVNEMLRWLSLDFMALDWIGSSDVALWTVMILIIWRESALGIILFLARLLSLDESLIEAAKLEGANWWQRARYIILPQMRGVIEFYVVVSVITMLSAVFAYVYVIGGGRGGPGTSTVVVEFYIFNALIRTSLPGIASAASVLLFLVSVALIFPLFRARRRAGRRTRPRDEQAGECSSKHAVLALLGVPGVGADDLHDLDGAEDGGGICDRQARLPDGCRCWTISARCSSTARSFGGC